MLKVGNKFNKQITHTYNVICIVNIRRSAYDMLAMTGISDSISSIIRGVVNFRLPLIIRPCTLHVTCDVLLYSIPKLVFCIQNWFVINFSNSTITYESKTSPICVMAMMAWLMKWLNGPRSANDLRRVI